jgi:hypothetical protein
MPSIDEQIAVLRKEKNDQEWAEYEKNERPKLPDMVGRCYKYRNSHGSSSPDWWFYKKITRFVKGDGVDFLLTEQFEIMSNGYSRWENGSIICGPSMSRYGLIGLNDGYILIDEVEYQKARVKFMTEMATFEYLTKKSLED